MKKQKKYLVECRTITVDTYEIEASSKKEAIKKFHSDCEDEPSKSENLYEGITKIELFKIGKGRKNNRG